MEPYLEPMVERHSFGFIAAIKCQPSYLHNRLQVKISYSNNRLANPYLNSVSERNFEVRNTRLLDPNSNRLYKLNSIPIRYVPTTIRQLLKRNSKTYFNSTYLLDADIKGCFYNISHDWLIRNVTMPLGYEYLLPIIQKTKIVERGDKSLITLVESIDNHTGIPQGHHS